MHRIFLPVSIALVFFSSCLYAEPDLRTGRTAGKLTVYADSAVTYRFYYAPADLKLSTTKLGKPELSFLLTRYTGTRVMGDQGTIAPLSLLSYRIKMTRPTAKDLREARMALSNDWYSIELRPLPIRWLEAAVIYTPLNDIERGSHSLPGGVFEGGDVNASSTNRVYWLERTFTIRLDSHSAQALWDALAKGKVLMSLGYAFFSEGIGPNEPIEEFSGTPELINEVRKHLKGKESKLTDDEQPQAYLVKAGVVPILIDKDKWPSLMRKVDINERIPSGYPMLSVYCYDFNNALQPNLYMKEVEVQAKGVTGKPVKLTLSFDESEPDIYSHNIRFKFAVDLKKPYRYRIIEIMQDGDTKISDWTESERWAKILDVSTPRLEEYSNLENEEGKTNDNEE